MSGPKEGAYDEHISPLMTQIIRLCKAHKINMAAQFALDVNDEDSTMFCTTVLHNVDPDNVEGVERMRKLREVMNAQPLLYAFTIRSSAPAEDL